MIENVNQQLGNYRLIRHLGRGGFADVYLGEHIYLKTQAAIKVLRTHLTREDVETFRTEALTVAHLVHPHIIRVMDFDVENTVPFLVMEYAPDGNLRQRHPKGVQVPPAVFLPYVQQVASALQYAHDRKLIHRDVKPENMLVGHDGGIILSDFGSALVAQNSLSQSTEDTVIGTMTYMAPEQIQGKTRPASDQYALAVVIYEWISGTKPFNGSFIEIMTQHLSASPPPLNNASPAVQQVVMRALAKDPHQRFPRVQDFANALEQAYQTRQQPVVIQQPAPLPVNNRPPRLAPSGQQSATPVSPVTYIPQPTVAAPLPAASLPGRRVKKGLKWGFRVLALVILLSGLLLCGLGFAVFHFFTGQKPSSSTGTGTDTAGATAMANDFVQALLNRNYDQAYNDLSPSVVDPTSRSKFKQNALSEDQCYGSVTGYKNAGTSSQNNSLKYTYTMTRSKLQKPYQLYVTVQQNSSGNWQIVDYESNLGSIQPGCP